MLVREEVAALVTALVVSVPIVVRTISVAIWTTATVEEALDVGPLLVIE
jgi:hypothetical protein